MERDAWTPNERRYTIGWASKASRGENYNWRSKLITWERVVEVRDRE